jgi:hypothetical protein
MLPEKIIRASFLPSVLNKKITRKPYGLQPINVFMRLPESEYEGLSFIDMDSLGEDQSWRVMQVRIWARPTDLQVRFTGNPILTVAI